MTATVNASLPNAIVLVLGSEKPMIPEVTSHGLIWASDDALVIGGTSDVDGKTTITITSEVPRRNLIKLDSKTIRCSSGKLSVETAYGERLLNYDISDGEVFITIWVDRLDEPGIIHLQLGAPHQPGWS